MPSPSASGGVSAPAFGIAPDRMDRFASVEGDGMRFRIAMDRNPMPAGEWTRVFTEVTNVGPVPLTWMSDGCAKPGVVWGEMEDVSWQPGQAQ